MDVFPAFESDAIASASRHARAPPSPLAKRTLAMVLAGGRGSRLAELTDWRAKPSLPFGSKYRIIDFVLSNCVNSGIRRIGICTQYKAQSLIRHVQRGWSFLDGRVDEFVELLPAQQRVEANWYQGTADAVYQNLDILRRLAPDFVLILAGDHIYKMDYGMPLEEHFASGAQVTIAGIEVPLLEASAFGVMCVDDEGRVLSFAEKPVVPMPVPGHPDLALASMGIYVFDADFLYGELLHDADERSSSHDFGRDLIPRLIASGANVRMHDYADSCVGTCRPTPYWRDVGTIDAYWEANLALAQCVPELDLYDTTWPILTYQEQLPSAKFVFDNDGCRGTALDSLVGSGCIVSGSVVRRSLLFANVRVRNRCTIEESVLLPNVDIESDVVLKRVIVDKHCRLPEGLVVGVDPAADRRRFRVTGNGVTLITPEMLGQQIHHLR